MRTEHTENITSRGVTLSEVVTAGTVSHSLSSSAHPAPVKHYPGGGRSPGGDYQSSVEVEGWKVDEHWTAVSAYLVELYLPDEG